MRNLLRRGGLGDVAAFEDAYQVLRANLVAALSDVKQPRVMVTSPSGSEGRTITCVNLALAFARAGQRVVVLDLDLRHPDAHRLLGAHNDVGLTDLLLERRPPEQCLQHLDLPEGEKVSGGIYFLGTGPVTGNPAKVLGLEQMVNVLDLIGEQTDMMLIDTPSVLSFADALLIGRMVSGALLIAQAHRTTTPELARARDVLVRNQTRVLGVALNRFDRRDRGWWEGPTWQAAPPEIPA